MRIASSSLPLCSRNTSATSEQHMVAINVVKKLISNSKLKNDKPLPPRHSADQEVARSRFTSGMQLVTKCKELHNIISNNRINLDVL